MKRLRPLAFLTALYALFLTAAFAAGYLVRVMTTDGSLAFSLFPRNEYALLDEVRSLLALRYIAPLPDEQTLQHGAARGLVSALGDPYTVFVEPQAHELQTQSLQGEYGGIGVELSQLEGGEIALAPFEDSPAARAGVLAGDVLRAVDGVDLAPETTLDEATARLRGLVNTPVVIRARRTGGTEYEAQIVRAVIPLPSVTARLVEGAPEVGLIAVNRFSDKTADEMRAALKDLGAQGATRFVLDLRNNGGGILEAGVETAGLFLDGGVVMYETQRDAPEKTYTAPPNAAPGATAPLAVLVNGGTASAAEIVAGALLDRGRAPLIGQKTFGKGSVQLVYDLRDGSSLHVTAYLWFTPSRRPLDKQGLAPTIAVAPGTDGSDPELARAVEYVRTGR